METLNIKGKQMTDEELNAAIADAELESPTEPAAKLVEKVRVGNDSALKRFIDSDQVKKDIAINPNDLDTALLEHASIYIHYAEQTVKARRQYDRLKNAFEILEARLDGEYRESLGGGAKKPTEASIRNALVADKRWSGAQAKVIEAGSIYRYCEVVENAMSQRRDMILELARNQRKEREGELRVLENKDIRERVLASIAEKKIA